MTASVCCDSQLVNLFLSVSRASGTRPGSACTFLFPNSAFPVQSSTLCQQPLAPLSDCARLDERFDFVCVFVAACSPKDALLFSMEAQQALLSAPWPPELLSAQQCAPVYVQGM